MGILDSLKGQVNKAVSNYRTGQERSRKEEPARLKEEAKLYQMRAKAERARYSYESVHRKREKLGGGGGLGAFSMVGNATSGIAPSRSGATFSPVFGWTGGDKRQTRRKKKESHGRGLTVVIKR